MGGNLEVRLFHVDNSAGWRLALRRYTCTSSLQEDRNPVLIVPGYGMNSFIFSYHPTGDSMAEHFARAGFEFWTVDLRKQGDSLPTGGSNSYGLEDVGITDMTAVLDFIVDNSLSTRQRVDVIGCSLGATCCFIHVGFVKNHRIGCLVTIGGPLRWETTKLFVKAAFFSPKLAASVPIRGSAFFAELVLPLAKKVPWTLAPYMRMEHIDIDRAKMIARTVEDPVRRVNEQIANWVHNKDLLLLGKNLTEEVGTFTGPLFCLYANADGIVPKETALSALQATGSRHKEMLQLGDDRIKMAHADIYISRYSHQHVFDPIIRWLEQHDS